MKKSGFTTVELIITFALTTFIMIFLFEVVIIIRETFTSTGFKTELVSKQANISRIVNRELNEKNITNIINCGNNCIEIHFDNETSQNLIVDRQNNLFTFGEYTTELVNNSSFGLIETDIYTDPNIGNNKLNSILKIKIPIHHQLYDEDFGLNIIYLYDDRVNDLPLFTLD